MSKKETAGAGGQPACESDNTIATQNPTLLEIASEYAAAGLSIIPIRPDGSKAAACPWADYQREIAGPDELRRIFSNGCGIAIVGGRVSGNLEIIDFDDDEIFMRFCARGRDKGRADLLDRLPRVRTPRGHHLFLRCESEIGGSQKLAQTIDGQQRIKTLIETRGEGSYALAPGCPAACHPSGKTYELESGDLLNPPILTADERDFLLSTARELNQRPEATCPKEERAAGSDGGRPGDDFNARATWPEILGPHGWRRVSVRGEEEQWRRPEKDGPGISATINYKGSGLLYVFSTNTPFEPERGYSKFSAYAILNHGGDFQATARELAARGFGDVRQAGQIAARHEKQSVIVHWAREALEPQPAKDWIVRDLIGPRDVAVLIGDAGSKKTWSALDLAVCVALGEEWLGRHTFRSRVVIVDEESGERRLKTRLGDCMRAHEAGPELPIAFTTLAGITLATQEGADYLSEIIRETEARFVVMDALQDFTLGMDENSGQELAPVIHRLKTIAEKLECAIWLLHHLNKQGSYRGHSSIKGLVDLMIKCESDTASSLIEFTAEKTRDSLVTPFAATAHFEIGKFWLSDADPRATGRILSRPERYVIEFLKAQPGMTATMTAIMDRPDSCSAESARRTVYKLASDGRLARTDNGGRGVPATYRLKEVAL